MKPSLFIVLFLEKCELLRNTTNSKLRNFNKDTDKYEYSLYGAIILAYTLYLKSMKFVDLSYWDDSVFVVDKKRFKKKPPGSVLRWATRDFDFYTSYKFEDFLDLFNESSLSFRQIAQLMKVMFYETI